MSGRRTGTKRTRGRLSVPNARLPRLPNTPRNPPGYGTTEITLRTRGLPQASRLKAIEPAGDPPEDWPGTRPEWAVKWGLDRNGLVYNEDYYYDFNVGGFGASYFSKFDFVVPDFFIAIEVQGEFWHYGQGSEKIANDEIRRILAAAQSYKLIFVDETAVLEDPESLVSDALRGVDNSKAGFNKRG